MVIVIDASVAIAWCLRDRHGMPYVDEIVERIATEDGMVPDLFWNEMRNVLLGAERNGRIKAGTMEDHLKDIRRLPLSTDSGQSDRRVAALARRHGLSGYDAAYLETAKRRGGKLATLDRKLALAAANEGVSI